MERVAIIKDNFDELDLTEPEIQSILQGKNDDSGRVSCVGGIVSKELFFDYNEKPIVTKAIRYLEDKGLNVYLVDPTYNLMKDNFGSVNDKYTTALELIDNSALMALGIAPIKVVGIYAKKIRIKTFRLALKDGWNIYLFRVPNNFHQIRSGWFNLETGIVNKKTRNPEDFLWFGQDELIMFNQFVEIYPNKIKKLPDEYKQIIESNAERTLISFDPFAKYKTIKKFMPFCQYLKPLSSELKLKTVKIILHGRKQTSGHRYMLATNSIKELHLKPYFLPKVSYDLTMFEDIIDYFKQTLKISIKFLVILSFKQKIKCTFPACYLISLESSIVVNGTVVNPTNALLELTEDSAINLELESTNKLKTGHVLLVGY